MSEQYLSQDEIDALLDETEGSPASASEDGAAEAAGAGAERANLPDSLPTDAGADEAAANASSDDGDASAAQPGRGVTADTDSRHEAGPAQPAVTSVLSIDGTLTQAPTRPYDLASQERIVRARMPALELIHERFARSFGLAMFGFMQRNPEIEHTAPQVGKYADFISRIEAPSSINIMQTRPLSGSALLILDGALVSTIVDLMFGGSGRPARQNDSREFSITEQRLIKKVIDLCCTEYAKAWEGIHPFELVFSRAETQPQFANIAIPTEMVISTRFTLHFNELSGSIQVCIPYSVVEPVRDLLCSPLNTQGAPSDRNWLGQMSEEIKPAHVELVAELTTATLTLGELMNLRTGDVIEIEPGPDAALKIGKVPIFNGRYGEHNGRYAVRIDTVHSYTEHHQD
ncbi:MAG: flagellar motor switch protein FliM [Lautropia sp.]|nr:flagellar motor switch protein FliM [Lautropia sp.]